ncbi:transmembrane 4 L6 family member 4 [Sphaeramia orbicularis]|uniref:transmembrane 4 L6 family member 4 n=1 Tax=Sphaeramia orbicularis TaxID=375764 RepID=UPI0011801938|nr:transmembrane 4 L6 family member 4 [Sphaeramia orbicularis]
MCSGGFAKCLGICLIPLAILCVLCNILLFFPGGTVVDTTYITTEAFYFGGIVGSGVLMIFPALVFLGLKNNDCCGCCGNESCGRRFAMLSSILFAAVGVLGAGYSVIVSAIAMDRGPRCRTWGNDTYEEWNYPFSKGDYLSNHTLWEDCEGPKGVVTWHLTLFSMLLIMGVIQVALCAVQVVNGLLGALCGDCGCCGCCGGSDGAV